MAAKKDSITDILRAALFGEKKKTGKKTSPTQEKSGGSVTDDSQIALLRSIAANARISARNTMALPAILQQTNIMQKNVAKLVRLQGSNPTSKADAFFASSKFREGAYEATYRKNMGPDNTAPTQDKPTEKKGIADLFGSMFGIFKSVFNVDFLKKVLIGGAIIGGLTKYFGDSDFRKQVNGMLTSIRQAFITDEAWEKLKSGFIKVGIGAIALYGALKYVTMQLQAMAIANAMGRYGVPVPGTPGGRGRPGRTGRGRVPTRGRAPAPRTMGGSGALSTLLNAGALVGFGYNMISSGSEEFSGSTEPEMAGTSPESTGGPDYINVGLNTIFAASAAGSLVYNAKKVKTYLAGGNAAQKLAQTGKAQSIIGKIKGLFTAARAKSWGPRFMKKLSQKLGASALGKRILKKVLTAVGGFFLPGPGWVATVWSLIWIAADLYFLYTIFESIYTELSREDSGGTTSPTNTEETAPANSKSSFFNTDLGLLAVSPMAFIGKKALDAVGGISFNKAMPDEGAYKNTQFADVKDTIIAHEGTGQGGRNPYDTVYAFGKYGSPDKKLTDMTIGEVQTFQTRLISNTKGKIPGQPANIGSGAVGAYQFTKDTLATLAQQAFGDKWKTVRFDAQTQDLLAKMLFDSRKASNQQLSGTWAAFADLNQKGGAALRAQGAKGANGANTFRPNAPSAPTATSPQMTTVVPFRNAAAIAKPAAGPAGPVIIDNSQTVNAPMAPGSSAPAPAMPSVYNPEMFNLSNLMRVGTY